MLEWEQKRTRCGGAEQGVQLVEQLKGKYILRYHDVCILLTLHCPAYLYKEAPFHKPCIDPLKRLEWWREVGTDSGGQVLAVSTTVTLPYFFTSLNQI